MDQMERFLPWLVGITGVVTGAIGSIFALYQQYKKNKTEITIAEKKARSEEIDETLRRLYAHLDRVEKEHNDDRANLAKLHEDYMVVRDELARSRERCAHLEKRLLQFEPK